MQRVEPGRTVDAAEIVVRWGAATGTSASVPSAALVPGGLAAPPDIPVDVFAAALETFVACERLDMGQLAESLGWSRATLYRKAPPRETLLGAVVWFLTRRALVGALESTGQLRGAERVATCAQRFIRFVSEQPAFRTFLEHEPEVSLRVMTSRHGPVQGGLIAATQALLEQEEQRGHLTLLEDPRTLAYAIVRLGEGFLYADVLTGDEPDGDSAGRVISLLLAPLDRR